MAQQSCPGATAVPQEERRGDVCALHYPTHHIAKITEYFGLIILLLSFNMYVVVDSSLHPGVLVPIQSCREEVGEIRLLSQFLSL